MAHNLCDEELGGNISPYRACEEPVNEGVDDSETSILKSPRYLEIYEPWPHNHRRNNMRHLSKDERASKRMDPSVKITPAHERRSLTACLPYDE